MPRARRVLKAQLSVGVAAVWSRFACACWRLAVLSAQLSIGMAFEGGEPASEQGPLVRFGLAPESGARLNMVSNWARDRLIDSFRFDEANSGHLITTRGSKARGKIR